MIDLIYSRLSDPDFMALILAAIAAAATVVTFGMPLVSGDNLDKRMRAVSVERERIRARERERLSRGGGKASLRQTPGARIKQMVEQFRLGDWLGTENAKLQLLRAGFRHQRAEYTFLIARLLTPIAFVLMAIFYVFVLNAINQPMMIKLGIVITAAYLGIKAPELFLSNAISKRQLSIRRAWPDSLDLMLICVESGMSIEQAFQRVGVEVGASSVPLAEELTLTTAELSYLSERRIAYENLAKRTGLETVKSITTALIQAERYGTPIGQALRVLAQESRDQRMNEAEKKAAALPPKLTVPMILFFLPVLFAVIMTPALIQVFNWR